MFTRCFGIDGLNIKWRCATVERCRRWPGSMSAASSQFYWSRDMQFPRHTVEHLLVKPSSQSKHLTNPPGRGGGNGLSVKLYVCLIYAPESQKVYWNVCVCVYLTWFRSTEPLCAHCKQHSQQVTRSLFMSCRAVPPGKHSQRAERHHACWLRKIGWTFGSDQLPTAKHIFMNNSSAWQAQNAWEVVYSHSKLPSFLQLQFEQLQE